jgi:hypothetical protein
MVVSSGPRITHHHSAVCYRLFHLAVVCNDPKDKPRARISVAHLSKSNSHWHGLVGTSGHEAHCSMLTYLKEHLSCWNRPIRVHSPNPATLRHRQRCLTPLRSYKTPHLRRFHPYRIYPGRRTNGQGQAPAMLCRSRRCDPRNHRRRPLVAHRYLSPRGQCTIRLPGHRWSWYGHDQCRAYIADSIYHGKA